MSDRYDGDDLSDAEKTALDEQIVERDSGDPNSDREYLQDLPPAGSGGTSLSDQDHLDDKDELRDLPRPGEGSNPADEEAVDEDVIDEEAAAGLFGTRLPAEDGYSDDDPAGAR